MIKNSPLLPLWEKKFQEEAVLRTIHHGTHIEGNKLNLNEVQKVVEGEKIVARERDVQEVINYRDVIKYIEKKVSAAEVAHENLRGPLLVRDETLSVHKVSGAVSKATSANFVDSPPQEKKASSLEIDESLIKKLHQLTTNKVLSPKQCGVYRNKQVVVRNSQTAEVTFRPPPAVEVPYLMEGFLSWLNGLASKDIHPILKAGVTQYEIVYIHPFLDGNGRVARALAVLILYKEGYDIRRFFSLEEYYDKDAEGYYRALQRVKSSDLTPWLEYFTQGLAIELTRVKDKVQKLSQDLALKEKLGGKQVYLSERQIKIMEYIRRAGFFQNKDFSQLFPMISEDTVLRELKDLMKKGIIKKKGKTKAARYVLKTT